MALRARGISTRAQPRATWTFSVAAARTSREARPVLRAAERPPRIRSRQESARLSGSVSSTTAPVRGYAEAAAASPKSVTVVIPSYNGAHVIQSAIASVCRQTGLPWNLVVVDDASTDDTFGLLHRLASNDNRITLVRNDCNLGISATLNRGLRLATGDFVLVLHQDCRLESSDWLARAVAQLEASDSPCLAGIPRHDVRTMSRTERWFWITHNHIYSNRTLKSVRHTDSLFSENKCDLFETQFLRNLGGFDEGIVGGGEDQLLADTLARGGVRVVRDLSLSFSLTLGHATNVRQNLRTDFGYGQQMRQILARLGLRAVRRNPDGGLDRRLYNRVIGVLWILATLALVPLSLLWPPAPLWILGLPALARGIELEVRATRAAVDYELRAADLIAIPWVALLGDISYILGLIAPNSRSVPTSSGLQRGSGEGS